MATSLSEEHRSKLDSIIEQMEANGERPEDIQFVVNDFKTKYSGGQTKEAPGVASLIKGQEVRGPSSSASESVSRLAKSTLEMLPIPTSRDAVKRMLSPMPGQFGPSRAMQEIGEQFPAVQQLVGDAATKLSESKIGQVAPGPTAAAGSLAYALSHLLPPKLTPSEAAMSIGAEGGGMAVRALQRPAAAVGRGLAKAAESVSGLEYKTPGVLAEAANDSSLMFGQGKKAAGQAYEGILEGASIRDSIKRSTSPNQVLDEALKAFDDGSLTEQEALVARQAVDKVKNTLPKYQFNYLRDTFDSIAKKVTGKADAAYSRAAKSEALRLPLPVNKGGGTSIFKGSLGAVSGTLPFMLPAVQGAIATGAGIAGRQAFGKNIPGIRSALINALMNIESRRSKNGK